MSDVAAFTRWITKTRFAPTTQAVYVAKVADFTRWTAAQAPEYDEMLVNEHVRDYAARDYRRHLLVERKQAVATVELAMSALGTFFEYVGLGKPNVTRQSPPRGGPRALSEDDLRKVLRSAERRGVRDFALCSTLFLTAVRVSEAAALDVDDLFVSDRMGYLQVRHGKGGKSREVEIPAQARAALRPWLAQRRESTGEQVGAPLFTSRGGGRLSVRRMQSVVADTGHAVGVDISPHVLRHTFGRRFIESGGDLVALQEVLGHASVSTTAGYARADRTAIRDMSERVSIDL